MNLRQGIGILAIAGAFAALSAGLVHLGISAAAAYAMANYGSRVFDVTAFGKSTDFSPLIGGYEEANVLPDSIVTVGSSFTFGYPFPAALTYPRALSDNAVNVAAVGVGFGSIVKDQLCEMLRRDLHPRTIVLEIPLINELKEIVDFSHHPLVCSDEASLGLFTYALSNAHGIRWVDLLNDPYSDARDTEKINIAPVPAGYFITRAEFGSVSANLAERIRGAVGVARRVTPDVYVFVTPVYLDGVTKAGDDPEKIREQFEFALEQCRSVAGDRCIDTTDMLHRVEYYMNLTHLNGTGAAHLGKTIRDVLANDRDRA